MADFDFSQVQSLSADLSKAAMEVAPFATKAVEVTARNVKDAARKSVGSDRYFKAAAAKIAYDMQPSADGIGAEIGYDKGGAGNLGNLREFGAPGSPNHLAPHDDLANALHENEDDFQHGLEVAIADSLKAVGL